MSMIMSFHAAAAHRIPAERTARRASADVRTIVMVVLFAAIFAASLFCACAGSHSAALGETSTVTAL